jgi:DNA-binding MarR family transcriptional regulator
MQLDYWPAGADHWHVARTRPAAAAAFGPVLFECARLLDEIAQAEVNRQAGRRVLTPALVRLLPHLSREGIRPTELARRIDVSKQAVGQALTDLVERRLVELVADPVDGRARLVRLTESGAAAYDHGRGVLAFYAAALAGRLGASRVADLTKGLMELLPVLQEWAASGAPIAEDIPAGSVTPSANERVMPRGPRRRSRK